MVTDFGTQCGAYGRRTVSSKEVYQETDFGLQTDSDTQFTVVTDFGADCKN